MLTVDMAIHRVRRDITLGRVLKFAFACAVLACLCLVPSQVRLLALGGVFAAWVWVSAAGARGSRLAATAPPLIAAGQFEEAERQLDEAVRTFSPFRATKLQSLHQLAVLRHAQQRWQDAAALCRALLGKRLGPARDFTRPARLILANSLLETNDLRGAYEAISGLYHERLPLEEALALLSVQTDYEAAVGAWDRVMFDAPTKVALAELMPPAHGARVQALMALAAQKSGSATWADWLRRRVELLADVQSLCARRPMLWEVWRKPTA